MMRTRTSVGSGFGAGFERLEDRLAPAYVGDRVWLDNNVNGLQDAGEPGVAGISVMLHKGGSGAVYLTQTNASGNFWFPTDALPAGTDYWLQLGPLPVGPGAGYGLTSLDVGNDAVDNDFYDPNYRWTNYFSIAPGVNNFNVDAGLVVYAGPPAPFLGDRVWYDANANGLQDGTEPGISGVQVRLLLNGGVIAATTSGANGSYQFWTTGLPTSSNYQVQVLIPAGWAAGPTNAYPGIETPDNDVYGNGLTDPFYLTAGVAGNHVDAGLVYVGGARMAAGVSPDGLAGGGGGMAAASAAPAGPGPVSRPAAPVTVSAPDVGGGRELTWVSTGTPALATVIPPPPDRGSWEGDAGADDPADVMHGVLVA